MGVGIGSLAWQRRVIFGSGELLISSSLLAP